jgi:polysaccharide export outer membrane protein
MLLMLLSALSAGACARNNGGYAPAAYYPAAYQQPVAQQPQILYGAAAYGGPQQAYAAPAYAYPTTPQAVPEMAYTLDSGDKLRVVVFGQEGLTSSYALDANGNISMPLIGSLPARGFTTQQLAVDVTARLKQGYIREPQVAIEVEAYRPFFILGEVAFPGQYPYVANMTVETAVAIAGGYSPRAKRGAADLGRPYQGQIVKGTVPNYTPVRPGDTITVAERWF